MSENLPLASDNGAVLKHIEIYQGLISRMAANSSACKNWCIVLVSAFLAFVVKDGLAHYAWLALLPIALFCFLDASYLGLEKKFRKAFKASIDKLHNHNFHTEDLFVIKTDGKAPKEIKDGLVSWATLPVYLVMAILMLVITVMA